MASTGVSRPFWPPRGLGIGRIKLVCDLAAIVELDDALALKTKQMSADELLRFAFSLTEHTVPHPDAETYPFRFRFPGVFVKRGVATDCISIFRRLAASNVIADELEAAARVDLHSKESIQRLSKVVRLHALACSAGDLPLELTPPPIHPGVEALVRGILLYALATRTAVASLGPLALARSIRTLALAWRAAVDSEALPALAARLAEHSRGALAVRFVEAVCRYQHVPTTDDPDFPGVEEAAKNVADAVKLNLAPRSDLIGLAEVYKTHKGSLLISKAVATNLPPDLVGDTIPLDLAPWPVAKLVGEPYDL